MTADVHLRMCYALLAHVLRGLVRRAVRWYVLEPMRVSAERGTRADYGGVSAVGMAR